ncbi:MAG TPA: tRNA pseudouridine(55) synthase TruB [Burkholderiales bacterium]
MSARRRRGRSIDGVLLLNKPRGITSQTAVSRVKALLGAAKAGHTGTLDPLADGLLPVCLGEATKFAQGLLDADKSYRAIVRLGVTTATGDLEGEILEQRTVTATSDLVLAVLPRFRGEILQTPPMYSALKRDGKPLYAYARAGVEIERLPRRVTIRRLDFEGLDGIDLRIRVDCSKGTYVRVLAEDIGQALGCGACLAHLTRFAVGGLTLAGSVSLDALEAMDEFAKARTLLPADALVAGLPRVDLAAEEAARLIQGRPAAGAAPGILGLVRAYAPDGAFLGLAEAHPEGRLVARRLVSSGAERTAAAS